MPNKCCGEVLGYPCALTLSDEPLASAVEHGPVQLWVEAAQVGIPLHHFIDSEIWEQPARPLAERYPAAAQGYHAAAPPAQLPWTSATLQHWA